MALNLIHGVCESLSAGSKARSLATDFLKSRAPRCVYGHKDSADSELQVKKPKEYVNNFLMLEDSSMQAKF